MKKADYINDKLNNHGYAVDACVRSRARSLQGIRKVYFETFGDDFYETNEDWKESLESEIKAGIIGFPDENHIEFLTDDMARGNRQTREELLERVQW